MTEARNCRRIVLVYANLDAPGYGRRRCGQGFLYLSATSKPLRSLSIKNRLLALAAPPARRDVWYSRSRNNHILATGLDSRDRRQHIYHPKWVDWRDEMKFNRIEKFGTALPKIRQRVRRSLASDNLQELACASVLTL